MSRIQLFGMGMASKSPYVTAKNPQNMYFETRPAGEKSTIVGYKTPGLVAFVNGGTAPARALYAFDKNDSAYAIFQNQFYQVGAAGSLTSVGTLLTFSGQCSIADNGNQIMIVDGTFGYIYNTTTGVFSQITDTDFPASPTTVTFLAGRFIATFAQQSRFYWSDPYDGLSWDALNFTNAETNPDPNVAVWNLNGQAVLFGTRSTEFFGVSNDTNQAFASIQGTATKWGLAAIWSVAEYDSSLAFLARNKLGQVMVAKLDGYSPQKLSNPDVDNIINGYSTVSDAVSYSYMLGGHPMYVINFPTAGDTWLYDGFTQIWSRLKSYGITRHRSNLAMSFLTYTIVSDYSNGMLYRLTNTAFTDNGDQIESQIISENVSDPNLLQLSIGKLRVDMQVGMGDPGLERPQIGLSVSRDNGRTYGAEMLVDVGPIGNYRRVVEWNRLGTSRDFVFKLRMNDPFSFTLISATINPDN